MYNSYKINMETITLDAYSAINEVDKKFIGTDNYIGIAWFHAYKYRHDMRDITIAKRKKIHQHMMKAGIKDFGAESKAIEDILTKNLR